MHLSSFATSQTISSYTPYFFSLLGHKIFKERLVFSTFYNLYQVLDCYRLAGQELIYTVHYKHQLLGWLLSPPCHSNNWLKHPSKEFWDPHVPNQGRVRDPGWRRTGFHHLLSCLHLPTWGPAIFTCIFTWQKYRHGICSKGRTFKNEGQLSSHRCSLAHTIPEKGHANCWVK